jgi:phenylacetaldehyde dehydrogenase
MTTVQDVLDDIRKRPGTGELIPIIDPSTEEQIAEFTDCGPDAVNAAVARAKASAESGIWSQKPDYERAKILWRVAELIDKNAELLAELEMLNGGMYPAQAQMQVKIGAEWFRYYAGWCTKIDGIARDVNTGGLTGVDSHMHTYTVREPYDVVGLIFPWNGPVFNFCAKLAPSLAAGCNSVVKPAEETPLSAHVLMQILAEAGVPDGVAATPSARRSPRTPMWRRSPSPVRPRSVGRSCTPPPTATSTRSPSSSAASHRC